MSYLDEFLRRRGEKPAVDPKSLSRYSVKHDRWDMRQFEDTLREQRKMADARDRLQEVAGDVAYDEGADLWWELLKLYPHLHDDTEVRPDRLINKRVNEIVEGIPDLENVRRFTQGDPIAAALAFDDLEPEVERIYEQMDDAMEKQQQFEDALAAAMAAAQDQRSAEEMYQEWLDQNEGNEDADQDEKEKLEGAAQDAANDAAEAEAAAQAALDALEAALGVQEAQIETGMAAGLAKANEQLETIQSMSQSWGSEPGDLMRMPAEKRLQLAARLSSDPKFARMAKLIGPAIREAFAQQKKKTIYVPAEIVDITLGNDLPRVLPSELARLLNPLTRILFLKDFVQEHLVQYKMTDQEKVARGGIIFCHDGSGSMAGDKEVWVKAVGLAFMHVARMQKRTFYAIQFGSRGEIRIDQHWAPGGKPGDLKRLDPDRVIDFAEYFFGGGTDFQAPLNEAMKILRRENDEFGAVQSDIVFATDGCAQVSDLFMKELKELQAKLQATIWGISIGIGGRDETMGGANAEPLRTICDGKVATLKTLLNATDISQVFKAI